MAGKAESTLWAKNEVDGPLPGRFSEVMVASRVGVAAQALHGLNPREVHCALGLLLVSSNSDCRDGST